jgi:hypothetical protein
MSIKDDTDFESIDTIIQEQAHLVYKKENLSKSKLDSNDIIIYQQFFYVDVKTKEVNQIQEITYKNNQVLQIINHYYSNYNYSKPVELLSNFKKTALTYKIIREEEEEFTYTPIAEGAQLTKKAYMDINQTEIEIYGKAGVSSLIMFSFIGCAPCEMALRDFKAVNYDFKAPINLYYSSFQNKSAVLKKYLKGKGFPFKAFGQESNMIEDFSLYTAPSFALIDSDGKILKVIEGYSENVKDTLMGILEPTL